MTEVNRMNHITHHSLQQDSHQDSHKEKKHSFWFVWLPVLLLAVSAGIIYYMNSLNGLYEDDLWYATNLVTGEPLQDISDVIESQIWHYRNWGGRSMAHGLLQLSILAGGAFRDISNTVAIALLVFLTGLFAKGKSGWKYVLGLGLLVGLNPTVERTLLWQSGVANYLYMSIFLLYYIWVYLRELQGEPGKLPGAAIWMVPVGLAAGWSNENMGPAVLIGSLLVIWSYCRQHGRPRLYMITGSLSCLAGSVMLLLAPGNYVRADEAALAYDPRLYRQILNRLYWVSRAVLDYLLPAVLVLGFLLLLYIVFLEKKLDKVDGLLLLMAVLSVGAMLLSPHYPDRATFGTLVLICAEAVKLLCGIWQEYRRMRYPFMAICVFFWITAMYEYASWMILHLNLSW